MFRECKKGQYIYGQAREWSSHHGNKGQVHSLASLTHLGSGNQLRCERPYIYVYGLCERQPPTGVWKWRWRVENHLSQQIREQIRTTKRRQTCWHCLARLPKEPRGYLQ